MVQGSQRCLHTHNDPSTVTGSERVRASGAVGAQLRETCAINASLTALGRVISELVEAQRRPAAAHHHVPFRDSRLTFLLQARRGTRVRVPHVTIFPVSWVFAQRHERTSMQALP